jgi:uncharacterized membrane protein YgcG
MMSNTLRFGRLVAIAAVAFSLGVAARAQVKASFPPLTGKRVYVEKGVPDSFEGLESQIAKLERSSPQTYYVVVVRSSGTGPKATTEYVEELRDTWRTQASQRGRSFDPERSVIVVAALDNRQMAVLPGKTLRDQFGLHPEVVHDELIEPVLGLAREQKYAEAISALLNKTNNWIAAKDRSTAAVADALATPSLPKATTNPPNVAGRGVVLAQRSPTQQKESSWMPALFLGVLAAAIAVAALVWKWYRYRRTRDRLAHRLKEIRSKAVEVMDRLDGLKDRLKLLPTSAGFTQPMAGVTLAHFHTVHENVDKLWDGWLQVMEMLDKAQKLEAKAGSPLSTKALGDLEEMVNKQGSFEEIEALARASDSELEALTQAHTSVRVVLDAVAATRPKIDAALDLVKKLGLPTGPYEEELGSVDAGTAGAGPLSAGDPMGARTALEPLRARAGGLLNRIERVASLFRDAQQAKTALEALTRQVAGHRAQGLKLVEEGGNPDQPLQQGVEAHGEALTALRSGDPDSAVQKLETARSKLQEAKATVESVQKAKAFCEREQAARVRETQRLREALPHAESYQNDLEREFARESWQPVARNLEQARALLATFDRQAKDAAAAASNPAQQYLAAAQLYEQLAQQQRIVLRLMSGLSEQLNSLISVRSECRKLGDELATRERQVELFIRQNEPIVGDVTRSSLSSAQQGRVDVVSRSSQSRPDWPALRQDLAKVIEEFAIAKSQAEEDVRGHEELTREFEQVRQTANRVYALLAGKEEDRLAANQHYQAAADILDRIGLQIGEARGTSARLLQELRGAAEDLRRAEQLALEDVRLAAQATSEINEASRSIRQAGGDSSMGFGADLSLAESQLNQAEQCMQSQNYEQAIQLAGAAIQSARQTYHAAMQQALAQQAMMEAEQRRQAVQSSAPPWNGVSFGAAAATAAAAVILERAISAPASEPQPQPEPQPAPQPDSGVAVGSWSSDAGQGNW